MIISQIKKAFPGLKYVLFKLVLVLSLLTVHFKAKAQFTNKILETNFSNLPTVTSSSSTLTTGTGTAAGYSWIRTTINNTTTTWPYVGTATATNIPTVVIGTSTSASYIDLPALTFVNGGTVYVDYGSGSNREFELLDVTSGTGVSTGITGGNGSSPNKFKVDNTTSYPRNTILNNTLTLDATLFNGVKKLRISFPGGSDSRLFKVVIYTAIDTPPTTQASNITFTNISFNGMTVNWVSGNGAYRAVFVKENTGTISNPVDATIYTPSADWNTKGTQLGSSGYYCVYNGTGNSVNLTNLNPATTYTVQVFEYNGADALSKFLTTTATGNPTSQQTRPLSAPTLTLSVNNILSSKVTGNAVITDGGSAAVTEKGFVWSTTSGATINTNLGKINSGTGLTSFSSQITGLTPSTKYYVRAYAINNIGTAYSNEVELTTAAPTPLLLSSSASIDFGDVFYKATVPTFSYILRSGGANFTTPAGNITVTAPAGFQVSLNATTGFSNTLTIPYSASTLPNTTIYVRLPSDLYGVFSGEIIHTGGGVSPDDADRVVLSGRVVQEEISNMGTDFWLGFGYMSDMNNTSSATNAAKMVVYVAAGNQPATVTVTMANGLYSQTKTIPANSIESFEGFPIASGANAAGDPDSRLFSTGVYNRGINVNSNGVPVSVWTYTYTRNNSSAGAVIFPTDTWSSSYTVQAYGGNLNQQDKPYEGMSNQRNPNSFFYVIAAQDNTNVTFKPSNHILKQGVVFKEGNVPAEIEYEAGKTYTITLNKGQIFHAQGYIEGNGARNAIGLDLSGTTITTNDCNKKIAVFAGNGRSIVSTVFPPNTSNFVGSDNLLQQMFPLTSWGTKYLTVPTKTMEYNVFRIYVRDNLPLGTIVKVNGTVLGASYVKNNLYYEYETNVPVAIEGNKPISVAQFIVAQSWAERADIGNIAKGDPEMIILSPVQQAIKNTIVATPNLRGTDGASNPRSAYINVVLQKQGIASFKLDGLSLALDTGTNSFDANNIEPFGASGPVDAVNAFKQHPGSSDYVYAKFRVAMGDNVVHTVSSEYSFNAIAYGLGQGESYAFNAGSAFRDLSSIKLAVNTSATDTSSTTVKVAKGTPVKLQIALPHPPATVTNIQWVVPSSNPTITPAGSSNGVIENGVAKFDGTIQVDGRTFYVYSSPVNYTFSDAGSHFITAIATGSFVGDCAGSDEQKINVLVGLDNIDIAYQTNCGNPVITFTNNTTPMEGTTITKWLWNFGDNTTSDLQNPPAHTYNKAAGAVYTVRLTTTNSAGIVSTKTMQVDFSGEVTARFTHNAANNKVCAGGSVDFNSSSSSITSSVSGVPVKWTWNFGDGTPLVVVNGNNSPIQNHVYSTIGNYTVSLVMETSTGCSSTYTQDINVYQLVPAVISATSTINAIEFSWDAIPNATRYEVSTDNGATYFTPSSGASGTSHLITGLQPDQTIKLIVRASGLSACESITDEFTAKTDLPNLELFVPNTFTPNGDGVNDELKVLGNYLQSVNMRIFNQWGEQIFFTTELNKGWDGTYKGANQPVGVYIYVITVVMQDGTKINKKGSVNLIR